MNSSTTAVAAILATGVLAFGCTSQTASVPVRWQAPTQNEDGSQLEDLAGYRVYWKRLGDTDEHSVVIDDAATTSYVLEGLADGEWHVGVSAFNADRLESDLSTVTFTVADGEVVVDESTLGRTVAKTEFEDGAARR